VLLSDFIVYEIELIALFESSFISLVF
jgi:hypothetical protein